MSESQDGVNVPEVTEEPTASRAQMSRRAVVRAGLVVVPVLMTLPAVPAWAGGSHNSVYSRARCTTTTASCQPKKKKWGNQAAPQTDPFGASPFGAEQANPLGENPFKNP